MKDAFGDDYAEFAVKIMIVGDLTVKILVFDK